MSRWSGEVGTIFLIWKLPDSYGTLTLLRSSRDRKFNKYNFYAFRDNVANAGNFDPLVYGSFSMDSEHSCPKIYFRFERWV
mmetsp:Transcript_25723/g.53464  ORF Transcript_25723/g.53464 Transcript_25723/m.53464 type:complete len:81 (-) Transcript_25723:134-376(-)